MRTAVKQWGNSAAIRLPSQLLKEVGIGMLEEVDVRHEDGRIIIEKVSPVAFQLKDLLAGITEDNVHGAVEFGPPRGTEML